MKIKKTQVPQNSLIRRFLPADYDDSFAVVTDSPVVASADDVMVGFWTDMPAWVNALFKLRNFLVRFVGLKGGKENTSDIENAIREGGNYGFMEVVAKNSDETVIILRDKHLDAYMSVMKNGENEVCANTAVKYNNKLGKVYFFFIHPFHGLVVRGILKRTARKRTVASR